MKTVELPALEPATTATETSITTETSTTTATSTTILPPPPHGAGPAAVCTDGISLYVLKGSLMHQYALPDLTLTKTVELPKPELTTTDTETSATTATGTATLPPPPHRAGPSSICTNGISLYILQGPMMLQYTLPDLALANTVELPKPEPLTTETETSTTTTGEE